MSEITILIRVLLSVLLSGLIGLEREIHGCIAGLRTHILVSIGSTLFMITSIGIGLHYPDVGTVEISRIASGVVSGIGFLGAGAIIRYKSSIRGLTTAASIWAVAAIGLSIGIGMYTAAFIVTIVSLIVLVLSFLEERMQLKRHGKKLRVKLKQDSKVITNDITKIIDVYGGMIKKTSLKEAKNGNIIIFDLVLSRIYYKDIVSEVSSLPGIEDVYWK